MTIRSGREAVNRLRDQKFPSEVVVDDMAPEAAALHARELLASADPDPKELPDVATRRRRPAAWLIAAAVVVILLVVGLVTTRSKSGPNSTPVPPADQGLTTTQVLAIWEKELATTLRPLIIVGYGSTTQIGQWESSNLNNKGALLSRLVTLASDLTAQDTTEPKNGTLTWADGTTRRVDLLNAKDTAELLIVNSGSPQPCDGCKPVVLTDPQRTTVQVKTATGPATVPAFSFGVRASAVRLVQASIDPAQQLHTVPGLPYGLGDAETTVHVESDGRLTLRWTGAPSVAQAGGCGVDVRPEFVEGTNVVVLRFVQLRSTATDTPRVCAAYAVGQTATVQPPHPLAKRLLVLDRSGFVVPRI